MAYECPLCGTDFEHADCRSACPMSNGCTMVRCPRCGYEFVESGKLADMLRRWIRRGPQRGGQALLPVDTDDRQECLSPTLRRLTDLDIGASGSIAFVAPTSSSRINKLAAFGLVPGSEIRLISRRPAVVLECGATSIAVEDEIGRDIYVRVNAA